MEKGRILSSKLIFQNQWLSLREDIITHAGATFPYTVVERHNSVVVVPITPTSKTILLHHYRYPLKEKSWELPMGGIELGESQDTAARRELMEEAGVSANELDWIADYHPVPGLSPQRVSVFLARLEDQALEQAKISDKADDIENYMILSLHEAFEMARRGEITDGFTLAALLYVRLHLNANHDKM